MIFNNYPPGLIEIVLDYAEPFFEKSKIIFEKSNEDIYKIIQLTDGLLISGSLTGLFCTWDPTTGKCLNKWLLNKKLDINYRIYYVDFCQIAENLIAITFAYHYNEIYNNATGNSIIFIFNTQTGNIVKKIPNLDHTPKYLIASINTKNTYVHISYKLNMLLISSHCGNISIWNTDTIVCTWNMDVIERIVSITNILNWTIDTIFMFNEDSVYLSCNTFQQTIYLKIIIQTKEIQFISQLENSYENHINVLMSVKNNLILTKNYNPWSAKILTFRLCDFELPISEDFFDHNILDVILLKNDFIVTINKHRSKINPNEDPLTFTITVKNLNSKLDVQFIDYDINSIDLLAKYNNGFIIVTEKKKIILYV